MNPLRIGLVVVLLGRALIGYGQDTNFQFVRGSTSASKSVERIFIVPGSSNNCSESTIDAESLVELITVALGSSYTILERQYLDALLEEQRLSLSGLVLEETTIAAGCLQGSEAIVFCNVDCIEGKSVLSVKLIDCAEGVQHWIAQGVDVDSFAFVRAVSSALNANQDVSRLIDKRNAFHQLSSELGQNSPGNKHEGTGVTDGRAPEVTQDEALQSDKSRFCSDSREFGICFEPPLWEVIAHDSIAAPSMIRKWMHPSREYWFTFSVPALAEEKCGIDIMSAESHESVKRGFEEMSGVQIGGLSALIYNVQSISVDGIKGIQADWKIGQFYKRRMDFFTLENEDSIVCRHFVFEMTYVSPASMIEARSRLESIVQSCDFVGLNAFTDHLLKEMSSELNSTYVPFEVSKDWTCTGVMAVPGRKYFILNTGRPEVKEFKNWSADSLRMLNMAKSDPKFGIWKELGVTMGVRYFNHEGEFLRELNIRPEIYSGLKISD